MSEGEFHAYVGLLAFSGLVLSVLAIRGFGQRAGSRVADGVFAAGFLGYAAYLVVTDPPEVMIFYYAFAAPVWLVVRMVRERGRARRRRLAAGLIPQTYAAPPAPTPLTPFPPPPPPLGSEPPRDERPQQHRSTYQPLPSGLPGAPAASSPGLVPPGPPPSSPPSAPLSSPPGARRGMPSGLPGRSVEPAPQEAVSERPRHAEPRSPAPDDQAGHDTHGQHTSVQETGTRLRRPAYLSPDSSGPYSSGPYSPGPDEAGSGRHRASEPADPAEEPPADWPPPRH